MVSATKQAREAFLAGKSLKDNPYPMHDFQNHQDWAFEMSRCQSVEFRNDLIKKGVLRGNRHKT